MCFELVMLLALIICLCLQPIAVLGLILVIAGLFVLSGGWYFFVGVGYIAYVIIVMVVEMCIPGIYVHRLIVSSSIVEVAHHSSSAISKQYSKQPSLLLKFLLPCSASPAPD